jgi:hypothetical protein
LSSARLISKPFSPPATDVRMLGWQGCWLNTICGREHLRARDHSGSSRELKGSAVSGLCRPGSAIDHHPLGLGWTALLPPFTPVASLWSTL